MTLDPLASSEPPPSAPTFRDRAKAAVTGLATGAVTAWQWAKSKVETLGIPAVQPNDVLEDVLAYLDAHGLSTGASSFNHWKAAVTIARSIADDAEHLATKAVATVGPQQRVLLIAFAVEELIQFLASKGQAGSHADESAAPVVAVAGKIEPAKADEGPKGAA